MIRVPAEAVKNIKSAVGNKIKDYCLSALSGALLALSFPCFNLEPLAFFSFVPLFFALKNKNSIQAFALSYICGLVFFAITVYWIIHVSLLGLVLLVLYLALYFGLFGFFLNLLSVSQKLLPINFLSIPFVWILLEFIRSHLFTGFSWALLGYSQYLNLPVIQMADITGVWGVSFVVMMVNVAIWETIDRGKVKPSNAVIFSILCVVFTVSYGFYKLHRTWNVEPRTPIRVSVIQGNIPQDQKWDRNSQDFILERYLALTREAAAKDKPDLIIWPETSVPGLIDEDPAMLTAILKLATQTKTALLVGAITSEKNADYYNSAVLISSDGKIVKQYNKLHLVPFGEFVPLEKYLPFLRKLIGIPIGDYKPGKEYTVFKILNSKHETLNKSETKFSVLICFEDIFPELSCKFVRNGAGFLVNMTNDAWFKCSSAPWQHAQASVFRAVENRVPVVRAANTGLSCFIDEKGRIYDKAGAFMVEYKTQEVSIK